MGAPENLIANASKVAYTSYFNIDKIIVMDTDTTGNSHAYGLVPSGTAPNLLPLGIYSLDSGVTWYDGAVYNVWPGLTLAPSTAADCIYSVSGTNGRFTFGSGLTRKFLGLGISNVDYPSIFNMTGKTVIDTRTTYMKIALEGSFSVGAGLITTTVAHNLGYVPVVMVWYNTNATEIRRPQEFFGNAGTITEVVRMDSTNIYISTNQATTIYYRIYYDQ